MIIRKVTLVLLITLSAFYTSGCSVFKPETMYIEQPQVTIYRPETPTNPKDPEIRPTIITVERLKNKEIPDVAYVGFKYNEWLEFAKWLHKYRSVQLELREIIAGYEDINNDSTDVNSTKRTRELTE